ncbi:hypothetical protein EJ05DRAFT_472379 [Pseudovirgaria hyperparasitica]|uniref:VLRF1 domain-containing protein n=1 Tax=Pseudovirgaria hyperparasitica TaxID=470096 RepID=A0A6A6WMW7_9PEZI|nr:uncharacterized protein EJ05DRAFT_472379 [Pseudovirgaria hyperparasitica]KAF2763488.1 hypothetical protein EJ05DRAFT_472379 [Pseudovirgaria hyperparasitica]
MAEFPDHPLLQRPLYIFNLPEEILTTLTLQGQNEPEKALFEHEKIPPIPEEASRARDDNREKPTPNLSCALCSFTFSDLREQRSHVRSDLHGYNMKQKFKGCRPVSEEDFEKLVGDLDESISGSDSSDPEDEDGDSGTKSQGTILSALLKKQAKLTTPDESAIVTPRPRPSAGNGPMLWFSSMNIPENTLLGVYRAVLPLEGQDTATHYAETIKAKQLAPVPMKEARQDAGAVKGTPKNPHYFLCMIGGGHFAAMIVSLTPKVGKQHTGADQLKASVVAHKTFHRYTTRRKQGGSQSANDAAKGAAHSAGSSLRRYNEAALTNEVRQLLADWKDMISGAELLFIRATGSTNRRTLYGPYEGQVLRHNDPRLRSFPFSTRRATQNELIRSYVELTRMKISDVSQITRENISSSPTLENDQKATSKPPKSSPTKPSKEEEIAAMHTTQITSLIRRSKAPALLSYLTSNSLSPDFFFHPASQYHHTRTPLQLAASINSPVVISALLTKARADPTIMNDEARTPFQLAGDRATRDAFRVARTELGESAWDWNIANVPAALSKADAIARSAREVDETKAAEAEEMARRQAATEKLRQVTEQEEAAKKDKRLGKGRLLASLEKTAVEKREAEARGMTDDMRKKLERERRARAAEARMKKFAEGTRSGAS